MKTITLELDGNVALLTLNRPARLNSVNMDLIAETRAALADIAANPDARVVLLTGAGRAFCAGADLSAEQAMESGMSVGEGVSARMEAGFNPLIRELAELPKPVVAAVNGVAAGGGVGMALSADIVIAARSATFIQVFGPRLGIVPDMGCSWFLAQYLGRARARGLALTGDKLPAETAAEWGLIWKCVDDDKLMDEAMAVAVKLAAGPVNAFGTIKRALDLATTNTLAEHLDHERDCQRVLCDHPNFMEGVTAFLEKREPEFTSD